MISTTTAVFIFIFGILIGFCAERALANVKVGRKAPDDDDELTQEEIDRILKDARKASVEVDPEFSQEELDKILKDSVEERWKR